MKHQVQQPPPQKMPEQKPLRALPYLAGAIQLVRNFQEFGFRFRADVAAVPFQGDAVDHHETEADGESRGSGPLGFPCPDSGNSVPMTQTLSAHSGKKRAPEWPEASTRLTCFRYELILRRHNSVILGGEPKTRSEEFEP